MVPTRKNRCLHKTSLYCGGLYIIAVILLLLLLLSFVAINSDKQQNQGGSYFVSSPVDTATLIVSTLRRKCLYFSSAIDACNATVVVFGNFDGCTAMELNSIFWKIPRYIKISNSDTLPISTPVFVAAHSCDSIYSVARSLFDRTMFGVFVIRSSCITPSLYNDPENIYLYADSLVSIVDRLRDINSLAPVVLDMDGPQYKRKDFMDIFIHIAFHHVLRDKNIMWPQFPLRCASRGVTGCQFTRFKQSDTCDKFRTPPVRLKTLSETLDDRRSLSLHARCFHLLNSRKYSNTCFPRPEKLYPLLITGEFKKQKYCACLIIDIIRLFAVFNKFDIPLLIHQELVERDRTPCHISSAILVSTRDMSL